MDGLDTITYNNKEQKVRITKREGRQKKGERVNNVNNNEQAKGHNKKMEGRDEWK